jgi:hypothetical protein
MGQTASRVFPQPLNIAGMVPLWRGWGPGAFDRQPSLFPGNFTKEAPPLRNKNYCLRLFMEIAGGCSTFAIIKQPGRKFQNRKYG